MPPLQIKPGVKHPRSNAEHSQRVRSQTEQSFGRTDFLHAQNILPDSRQLPLHLGVGLFDQTQRRHRGQRFGGRQRLAVQFAVQGRGQFAKHDPQSWHHIARQFLN